MAETTFQLPQNVIQARDAATQFAGKASQYAAGELTIGDKLRETINRLYGENQELVNTFDTASSNFLAAPATARDKFQNIFNPFEREKLVSQYTQGEAIPMLSASNLIGHRFGRMEDMIGSGTRAYQAAAEVAKQKADAAKETYQNLLDEYTSITQLQQDQERIDISRAAMEKTGGGGGGTGTFSGATTDEESLIISAYAARYNSADEKTKTAILNEMLNNYPTLYTRFWEQVQGTAPVLSQGATSNYNIGNVASRGLGDIWMDYSSKVADPNLPWYQRGIEPYKQKAQNIAGWFGGVGNR